MRGTAPGTTATVHVDFTSFGHDGMRLAFHPFARMNFPPVETDALVAVLREELQQYGALLRLLETQRGTLISRRSDDVPGVGDEIENNLAGLAKLRARREREIQVLTGRANAEIPCDQAISIEGLLPHFPDMVAPMIRGLVEEVNRLVARVALFARENEVLISQALSSLANHFESVQPGSLEKAYASLAGI